MQISDLEPDVLTMTARSFWPKRVLDTYRFLPAPAAGHVAQTLQSFDRSCCAIGVLPERVRFVMSPYRDFYTCDFRQAWIPSAGLFVLSQDEFEPTGRVAGLTRSRLMRRVTDRMARHSELCRRISRTNEQDALRPFREFDQILTHPDIERLTVSDTHLNVFTGPIAVDDITLGRYVVSVHPIETERQFDRGTVSITNQDRRIKGLLGMCDRPHVIGGRPCLGNIGPTVRDLLVTRHYPAVFALLVNYLKIWNPKDIYCSPCMWSQTDRRDHANQ